MPENQTELEYWMQVTQSELDALDDDVSDQLWSETIVTEKYTRVTRESITGVNHPNGNWD